MSFLAGPAVAIGASIGGKLIQGVGGLIAGEKTKRRAYAQAREESLASAEAEREQRIEARRAMGAQIAAQFDNGMEGGTGTALDALRESQINAALDAMEIRRQGASRARAARASGDAAADEGRWGMASTMLGAASTYGQMKNDWAQARRGRSG